MEGVSTAREREHSLRECRGASPICGTGGYHSDASISASRDYNGPCRTVTEQDVLPLKPSPQFVLIDAAKSVNGSGESPLHLTASVSSCDAIEGRLSSTGGKVQQNNNLSTDQAAVNSSTSAKDHLCHCTGGDLTSTGADPSSDSPRYISLHQYGCCVFFFPSTVVSWLFPFAGHVAISNAESTKLYTFESSYYVREEKLVDVLGPIFKGEHAVGGTTALSDSGCLPRGSGEGCGYPPSSSDFTMEVEGPPQSCMSFYRRLKDTVCGSSTLLRSRALATPLGTCACTARLRSRPTRSGTNAGHQYTNAVRIWDLKPLLMESRGKCRRRLPLAASMSSSSSSRVAVTLWERMNELLQSDFAREKADSRTGSEDAMEGYRRSRTPSSMDDSTSFELLDKPTARFFNRNLQAAIKVFRGSPNGNNTALDALLQHYTSYSFVGFVLEACGVGGRLTPPSSKNIKTNADIPQGGTGGDKTAPGRSEDPGDGDVEGCFEEDIHWSTFKIMLNLCFFGEWHRSDRRVWRFLHGGSVGVAILLWALLLGLAYRCVVPWFT